MILGFDIWSHVEAMWWALSGLSNEWETGGTTFRQGEQPEGTAPTRGQSSLKSMEYSKSRFPTPINP